MTRTEAVSFVADAINTALAKQIPADEYAVLCPDGRLSKHRWSKPEWAEDWADACNTLHDPTVCDGPHRVVVCHWEFA